MKKVFYTFTLLLASTIICAQAPESFNYQAVIKNAAGEGIINQTISMQVSILQGSTSGISVYTETHQPETNAYGLVNIKIGEGIPVSGDFSTIEWGIDSYFIQIEVDINGGVAYTEIGTMQLVSVPYALYAKDVMNKDDADADPDNEIQTLSILDDELTITDGNSVTIPTGNPTDELQTLGISNDQLSISDGNTVTLPDADDSNEIQNLGLSGNSLSISGGNSVDLSGYQSPWLTQGSNVYFNNGNVGIGKSSPLARFEVKASPSSNIDDPLLQVINKTGDTVFAVYDGGVIINFDENTKGNIGGFAVSGRNTSKGVNDYFTVTKDSTRIYIDQPTKGNIGGFAVSGRNTSKSESVFLDLTPDNYLIGHQSGSALTSGVNNTFIGYQSGVNTTEGVSNIFIGQESGLNNVVGERNIFIGMAAGKENIGDPTGSPPTIGHDNIYIGTNAGRDNQTGEHNTLIGSYSGYVSEGTKNTFVGAFTGFGASGIANVFLGVDAGRDNTAGDNNVFIGAIAGRYNSGSQNTLVGYGAGYNSAGDGNVFIGHFAGLNETGSNRLYIDNSSTSTPLLYGYFVDNSEYLTINGLLNVNNNNFRVITNPGSSATPNYYVYQGITGSTLKEYAFSIHDALWVSSHTWIDGTIFNSKGTYQLAKPSLQNTMSKVEQLDIDKVLELQAEYFMWDESKFAVKDSLPATKQIGLNPNQVEKYFPELVKSDGKGNQYINYSKLSIILLEALKVQSKELEILKETDAELKQRMDAIEQKLK